MSTTYRFLEWQETSKTIEQVLTAEETCLVAMICAADRIQLKMFRATNHWYQRRDVVNAYSLKFSDGRGIPRKIIAKKVNGIVHSLLHASM